MVFIVELVELGPSIDVTTDHATVGTVRALVQGSRRSTTSGLRWAVI